MDIAVFDVVQERLLSSLAIHQVTIDASGVEKVATSCIQLLIAFFRQRGLPQYQTTIHNPSPAFRAAWADFGLQPGISILAN
jgi:anti-anti-sigma regulatory factor